MAHKERDVASLRYHPVHSLIVVSMLHAATIDLERKKRRKNEQRGRVEERGEENTVR